MKAASAAAAFGASIICVLLLAVAAPARALTEFLIPTASSGPEGITAGPDGNLWFTEYNTSKIGRITPTGTFTEFPIPSAPSFTQDITAGPDGNLWFTEGNNKIGRITPTGTFTEFSIPTASSFPRDITAGPDGNLWFTESSANKIGRITPTGTFTEFPLPTASGPFGITGGPDGKLWFVEGGVNNIARTSGTSPAIWISVIPAPKSIKVTIPAGETIVTKVAKVKVRNADLESEGSPGHTIQLTASDGDCPAGTVGMPDLDKDIPGPQDSVLVAVGKSTTAKVPVTVMRDDALAFGKKAPSRCTLSFTATTSPSDEFVVTPSSNIAPLVVDVIDENDF